MNSVELIGRLTRNPENNKGVVSFTLAIDRPSKDGEEKRTDYPRVTVFGMQGETVMKYLRKGRMTAVQGRIQTGSYTNRDGVTVYTTDVVANRVEFLDWGESKPAAPNRSAFNNLHEDTPF